jgi:hypothetical protein
MPFQIVLTPSAEGDLAFLRVAEQRLIKDGQEFILETADEFEQEIAALGQSEKFMSFLAERSREKGCIPLAEIERKLQKAEE